MFDFKLENLLDHFIILKAYFTICKYDQRKTF